MRDIALVSAVLMVAVIGLRRPALGMMTFAFLGFFNPHSFTWSFGRTFPLSQVVAISTILGVFLSAERKAFPNQRETLLLILLWGTFSLSTIFAFYPDEAFTRLMDVSKILLMTMIAMVVINSEDRLHGLIRVIGYSLGFYGLKGGFFAVVSGGGFIVYGPEESFLAANNSIGLALVMNIPVLLYLLKTERQPWLRWILRTMLLFSYPAIVGTYSRGAWLGLGIVTVLNVVKSRKKFVIVPIAGLVAASLLTILPEIAPERLAQRYDQLVDYEEESSAQSRFWNWEFCRRVGMARPVTGGGFNFPSIENYGRFYPEFLQRWPDKVWTCHSMWLTVFGEHGFPGAIVWLLLLGCCFMSLRQIRAYGYMAPADTKYVHYADMIQSSMIAFFVVGTFLDTAYFDMFYYLVAFVVIIKSLMLPIMKGVPSLAYADSLRARAVFHNQGRAETKVPGPA